MEKSQSISTQKLASSTHTFQELITFHLHLPLDPKIHQLLSTPDDLMQHLYEMELEVSAKFVNIKSAILKNKDYDTFLSFVLFRLNYTYYPLFHAIFLVFLLKQFRVIQKDSVFD
jgi:hypothetical protein